MPVDKSGRVYVVGSVPVLHPEAQTVDEMLEGWRNQQLCRNLDHDTIAGRVRLVERFIEHTNEFPWTWTPAMVEEFFSDLRSVKRRKQSTVRGYQNALRMFCSYVSDPDYGWDRVCEQRFGTHPAQVFFEWNTATPRCRNPAASLRPTPNEDRSIADDGGRLRRRRYADYAWARTDSVTAVLKVGSSVEVSMQHVSE